MSWLAIIGGFLCGALDVAVFTWFAWWWFNEDDDY